MSAQAAPASFCLRWGILATGTIAETFAKDLLIDPPSRGVTDVSHLLVAVASSRSAEIASSFSNQIGAPPSCLAYGSYDALVADPRVDAVYVASPHSHHYQNAMLALQAGKHVLCEKPFTVTARQAYRLVEAARERGCFLMEGMWTRFLPISAQIRQEIQNGAIGPVIRVFADNSIGTDALVELKDSYLTNKELAGGALLDLAVYPIHWIFQALAPMPDIKPSTVLSATTPLLSAGVDESTTILMTFSAQSSSLVSVQAIASASLRATADPDGHTPVVRIQGDRGEIQIYGRPWCPFKYRIIKREQRFGMIGEAEEFEYRIPGGGHGLCFEADEVARCVRDGRQESAEMPWKESLAVMEILDAVRKAHGLSFSDIVEADEYPVLMPAKMY
ncbi:hypothetical protein AbraIFM66951_005015 [Aspergillus brasiliensis]|uniref:D-xylose 1-dehydrogenase (NADP(+), D-xylono-1,5-lactone-forming) n=1 Tax=Aspergillus brasiliensis TaxID=319629 RepID=A0A9W5YV08_9EURO|nr:hypothetical protein AbraCBS73388_009071 [Aspergillus brasiliensis]GKZ43649.1 hypothetical protein AbraIFM66951_005015 [Aspergillus brasiliensis]